MPGVAISGSRMTVAGQAGAFVQGAGRRFRLEADHLELAGGFSSREGRLESNAAITGHAAVLHDGLARLGAPAAQQRIGFVMRPLPAAEETRMLLTLSARGDTNEADADTEFSAELWTPAIVFEALRNDLLSGAARRLSLSARTSLWLREAESEAGPALPVIWHLAPAPDGRSSMPARGLVESLDWTSTAAPPASPAAPEEDEPPESTSEALGRVNWSLKQLLLALIFLLIIVALK